MNQIYISEIYLWLLLSCAELRLFMVTMVIFSHHELDYSTHYNHLATDQQVMTHHAIPGCYYMFEVWILYLIQQNYNYEVFILFQYTKKCVTLPLS